MVHGDDAVYGILANPCNCSIYYQCEYNTTLEVFIAYERACNPCELWDQEVLTCVFNPDAPWVPECNPSTQGMGMKQCALFRKVNTYSGIDIVNKVLNCYLDYLLMFSPLTYPTVHTKINAILFVLPYLFNSTSRVSGECPLGVVDNPYQFLLGNETMDCAPGTIFNVTVCTCVHVDYGLCIVCSGHANGPF